MARLKDGEFEVDGEVLEALPNLMFRITITDGREDLKDKLILGRVSGQMKLHKIKVMPGDKVKVVMTPYDLGKGRITFRTK
jgi:translation initiation factor IF-1